MSYKEEKKRFQWIAIVLALLFGFMGLHHAYLKVNIHWGALKTIAFTTWMTLYLGECLLQLQWIYGIIILLYWTVSLWNIIRLSKHRFNYHYN